MKKYDFSDSWFHAQTAQVSVFKFLFCFRPREGPHSREFFILLSAASGDLSTEGRHS